MSDRCSFRAPRVSALQLEVRVTPALTYQLNHACHAYAGYWKIHGLATPIRLLLSYTKTPYVDEMFEQGDGPEFSREAWLSVKSTLDIPFVNLPYYIEPGTGVALTQSCAIMRYLGRRHPELYGNGDILAQAAVDQALDSVCDFRSGTSRCAYGNNPAPEVYSTQLPGALAPFIAILDKHAFLAGDKLSIADFAFVCALDSARSLVVSKGLPDPVAASPVLAKYVAAFEALPEIAAFRATPAAKLPFNNKVAMHQY